MLARERERHATLLDQPNQTALRSAPGPGVSSCLSSPGESLPRAHWER